MQYVQTDVMLGLKAHHEHVRTFERSGYRVLGACTIRETPTGNVYETLMRGPSTT